MRPCLRLRAGMMTTFVMLIARLRIMSFLALTGRASALAYAASTAKPFTAYNCAALPSDGLRSAAEADEGCISRSDTSWLKCLT
jgi:hypothetical protein